MIIADRKPFEEIKELTSKAKNILIAGCDSCVAVCLAGGEKEVSLLASELRMQRKMDGVGGEIEEIVNVRQCENEYVDAMRDKVEKADLVLSMACGVGVQTIAERYPDKLVYPSLNTKFMGRPVEPGVWKENCEGCGNCILHLTGGICPIARCSKSMLNGPCGGSQGGKCEVNPEIECGWQLIYDRLLKLGQVDDLAENMSPKDWSTSWSGGPRRVIKENARI